MARLDTAAVASTAESFVPSPWQDEALAVPREWNMALLAAKGGGKTHLLVFLVIRDVQEFGPNCRVLFVRRDWAGSTDFISTCLVEFTRAFSVRGFTFNAQSGVFRFYNGAMLQVEQVAEIIDLNKLAGRNFHLLLVDEAQHWASPEPLAMLRACLRGPAHVPTRIVIAGNAGGVGHSHLLQRFFKAAEWEPFVEEKTGDTWVRIASSYRDNPHVSPDYGRQLKAAFGHDEGMWRSLDQGDWYAVLAGSYFASVIDIDRNGIDNWPHYPKDWPAPYAAMDYGSAAPAVVFLVGTSPGAVGPDGKFYPRDSLIFLEELATNEPGSLTRGLGWTIPKLADAIKEMTIRWGCEATGVADDSCFSAHGHASGCIADELKQHGVYFYPARKGSRVAGWQILRTLLQAAGSPDQAGLYIVRSADYWWATAPFAPRDPKKPDDVDSRGSDHALDAARYATLRMSRHAEQGDWY